MKKTIKVLGFIALVAVIGFSMAALSLTGCDSGSDGDSVGPGFLGDTLEIVDQQVYIENETETGNSYTKYTGSNTLDSYHTYGGGTGGITNGKFNFTLGTPTNLNQISNLPYTDDYFFSKYYDNLTFSNDQANFFRIDEFQFSDGSGLGRRNLSYKVSGKSISGTDDYVQYVYVDTDVTISGKGKTSQSMKDGDGDTDTTTTKNFNISLKEGWNAVRTSVSLNGSFTGSWENPTSMTISYTESISLGDPSSCKWVLYEH